MRKKHKTNYPFIMTIVFIFIFFGICNLLICQTYCIDSVNSKKNTARIINTDKNNIPKERQRTGFKPDIQLFRRAIKHNSFPLATTNAQTAGESLPTTKSRNNIVLKKKKTSDGIKKKKQRNIPVLLSANFRNYTNNMDSGITSGNSLTPTDLPPDNPLETLSPPFFELSPGHTTGNSLLPTETGFPPLDDAFQIKPPMIDMDSGNTSGNGLSPSPMPPGNGVSPEPLPPVEEITTGSAISIANEESLGNWTNYNGIVFGEATIYDSKSGGGLAVSKLLSVNKDYTVGSTYAPVYDPTLHIGKYENAEGFPALLFGGNHLEIHDQVSTLAVHGGSIVMSDAMIEMNNSLDTGFTPGMNSTLQPAEQNILTSWFENQYELVQKVSSYFLQANDKEIPLTDLSSGDYLAYGPEYFKNQRLTYGEEIFENALFITVRTDSDVAFGQWWPIFSIIQLDVDWALTYDLVVFNFPDAVNVSMNSSTFEINNISHWSTTVDAWIGQQGMEERKALAEKVVYNFPNAGSIEANHALIQGTILAPYAVFTGVGAGDEGHIYGHIVVKDYHARGNFTIHSFALSHWAFDLTEDAIGNEVKTAAIALRQYLFFRDQPTNIRLSGGEFVLINPSGQYYNGDKKFVDDIDQAAIYGTSNTDLTLIDNVPLGAYLLLNTEAPEGFFVNDNNMDNPYTYMKYPISLTRENSIHTSIRYAEPMLSDIQFKMVDPIFDTGIAGATFIIVREADEFEDTTVGNMYTSDENGYFTSYNLPLGAYRLIQIDTPTTYELLSNGEFKFLVRWDAIAGKIYVETESGDIYYDTNQTPIIIENTLGADQNTVLIVKYADEGEGISLNSYTLSGAMFSLHIFDEDENTWTEIREDKNGDPIEIITNELGYYLVENLNPGKYRLAETKPPSGYALYNQYKDMDYKDTFPEGYAYEFIFNERISHYTTYIPNVPITTTITLQTNGLYIGGENVPLAGVSYRLEHLLNDGLTWEEIIYSVKTDAEGKIYLENLKSGSYKLTQLDPPAGYEPLDPPQIYFDLNLEQQDEQLSVRYNDLQVANDTSPVSIHVEPAYEIHVKHKIKTRGLGIYKIDGNYTVHADENGNNVYEVTYLEGAQFRLQRRTNARASWLDYGETFTSVFLYDDEGKPVLDSYGNHIAMAEFPDGLFYGDYQLVEVKAPDGYETNSNVEVTLNDGVKGYQTHLFTVTQSMTGTGQITYITEENYAQTRMASLTFRKIDKDNPALHLRGAEFALYSCNLKHEHIYPGYPDSCFTVHTPVLATSDRNGLITFNQLQSHDYLLQEVNAPDGYRLPLSQWLVGVNADTRDFTITNLNNQYAPDFILATGDTGVDYWLPNQKHAPLPATGGNGTRLFMISGILFLALGLFLQIKYKKQ